MEGRWDVGAEPEMSALRLTDGTQQEWERSALALPGVPGNVIKHPADPLAMGIWIPPGPPAHPDLQLAVLTGSCQEKRPALLARPVSMSSSATNPTHVGLPQVGAGGQGSVLGANGVRQALSVALVRSSQQEAWKVDLKQNL